MHLPRNAQLWLPGYLRSVFTSFGRKPERVWVMLADHFEPLRGGVDEETARCRVDKWKERWLEVATRHCDSQGRAPRYTCFYAEEEYRPHLLDALAEMAEDDFLDVEIHLHHDGESEQRFVDRISCFKETLFRRHGLLRKQGGRVVFGFVHGNWALDNSLPGGQHCGLNNEISLLSHLDCYADFTLPSAPSAAQTRIVNSIYWASDDPQHPKSHDTGDLVTPGAAITGDLLMVQGPLAVNWHSRKFGFFPRLETGELAAATPISKERVQLWFRYAPQIGADLFIKLFSHSVLEKNAEALFGEDLTRTFDLLDTECRRNNWELRYASAWDIYAAIEKARLQTDIDQISSRVTSRSLADG